MKTRTTAWDHLTIRLLTIWSSGICWRKTMPATIAAPLRTSTETTRSFSSCEWKVWLICLGAVCLLHVDAFLLRQAGAFVALHRDRHRGDHPLLRDCLLWAAKELQEGRRTGGQSDAPIATSWHEGLGNQRRRSPQELRGLIDLRFPVCAWMCVSVCES